MNLTPLDRTDHSAARRCMALLGCVLLAMQTATVVGQVSTIESPKTEASKQPVQAEAPLSESPAAETSSVETPATEASQFLRVRSDASGAAVALQTSIVRYRPAEGDVIVDLIGAVHIGEADYYETLNRQFDLYDVVLYELVAPPGTRIPKGGKKESTGSPLDLISWMQKQAQATLGLESQLEKVDYQKQHFVHADLSPSQMGKKMAERGDNALSVGLSAMAEMMRKQNKMQKQAAKSGIDQVTTADLMDMLDEPLELKKMMANQFVTSGVMETGMGETLNQLLIVDRNAAAMKVLQKQIVGGKKRIGIFYGAAHMPDFQQRMASELGLHPTKHAWIDAWDLTQAGESPLKQGTTGLMLQMLKQLAK